MQIKNITSQSSSHAKGACWTREKASRATYFKRYVCKEYKNHQLDMDNE